MRPEGALTPENFQAAKPLYCVYSSTHPNLPHTNDVGHIASIKDGLKDNYQWAKWFDGSCGYFFDNYFHALAYSLKQKAKYESRHNHSQATHPVTG